MQAGKMRCLYDESIAQVEEYKLVLEDSIIIISIIIHVMFSIGRAR